MIEQSWLNTLWLIRFDLQPFLNPFYAAGFKITRFCDCVCGRILRYKC